MDIEHPPAALPGWPSRMLAVIDGRSTRFALIAIAVAGLAGGLVASAYGRTSLAWACWTAGTLPVVTALALNSARDLLAGRMGVDAVALVSMTAALLLGEALAAAVVALMYAGGNVLEEIAVRRAERDLSLLIDRAPRTARRRTANGFEDIPVDQVVPGDALMARSGDVIPVDAVVLSCGPGGALIDTSAMTGEPLPVARRVGDTIFSGTVNVGETFEMRAVATAGSSAYAGIVRLVSAAQTAKAPFVRLADQFALLLLPVALAVAGAAWWWSGDPIRGLAVLVAATPCPLILAAPIAFIGGVSRAARRGVLIKGSGPLEALSRIHTVMFDKTGTLTVGGARLVGVETAPGVSADDVLRLAASLEQASPHVLAGSIVSAARAKGLELEAPSHVQEAHGSGLAGDIGGHRVRVGSESFVQGARGLDAWAYRAQRRASWRSALTVFVSRDDVTIGVLLLGDEIRRDTPRAIQRLRSSGVKRIVMVTGDRADAAETMASALDIDAVLADRVPADKVEAVATEQRLHPTLMVGDGINDAPALATADVGIAMGARGASASSEAADVVILVDRLDRVADALAIARRTRWIALQSIVVGMSLSFVAMMLAAFGYLTPVASALSQEAIDVAVILNALRSLGSGTTEAGAPFPSSVLAALRQDHQSLEAVLDRLRIIADALDDAPPDRAITLIQEAARLSAIDIVEHEQNDESVIYPRLGTAFSGHGLAAMSRAHREIRHQVRMLNRIAAGIEASTLDRYLVRDAQRVIESIEALVRLHSAQEEDIYEAAGERA